jgi:hypothetical protein
MLFNIYCIAVLKGITSRYFFEVPKNQVSTIALALMIFTIFRSLLHNVHTAYVHAKRRKMQLYFLGWDEGGGMCLYLSGWRSIKGDPFINSGWPIESLYTKPSLSLKLQPPALKLAPLDGADQKEGEYIEKWRDRIWKIQWMLWDYTPAFRG